MHRLLCLALAVLLGTCLDVPAVQPEPAGDTPDTARGELVVEAGALSYSDGRTVAALDDVTGAVPYRIVTTGPPALVTTANEQLEVTTWAVGEQCTAYPDMYPLVVQPPLAALAGLPVREYEYLGPVVLLDTGGQVAWRHDNAVLLWPPDPPAETDVAYLALPDARALAAGDLLFPLGEDPRLVAVEAATGRELWRTALEPLAAVAGVELWQLTAEDGLICLQYDYLAYEFVVFRRADGVLTARFKLVGQPATRLAYPGGFDDPLPLAYDGACVGVAVVNAEGSAQRWWFDLAAGTCETAQLTLPARAFSEENPLPIGGTGAPDPAAPPFPQHLLPTATGDTWRNAALVDAAGRVLVVTTEGCVWVDPDQAG
ncbi:PQQ-binding-like beta-propeller repeat protein [bacterium]|nr:PQQ-binding-like beta-propeller repeat protein [bacterium]